MGRHVRRAVGRSGSPSRGPVSECIVSGLVFFVKPLNACLLFEDAVHTYTLYVLRMYKHACFFFFGPPTRCFGAVDC